MALIETIHGEMDEALLEKREIIIDNKHEYTTVVEYCLKGCDGVAHRTGVPEQEFYFCAQHVHRSVHVTILEFPEGLGALTDL
jgi:hypothetical protein